MRSARFPLLLAALCLGLFAITEADFTGDASDYADSIVQRFAGQDYNWLEPGHLLWRPLGYLITNATLISAGAPDPTALHLRAVQCLASLALIGGLAATLCCYRWLRAAGSPHAAFFGSGGVLVTYGLLNFAQAGTPYVPGLALLLGGMVALSNVHLSRAPVLRSTLAGLLLAGAVFLWLPYALVLPAALLYEGLRQRESPVWRFCAVATLVAVLAGASVFVLAWRSASPESPFLAWLQSSSHGSTGISGIPRMAVGLARSLVSLGNAGVEAKRFMVHDPYNPVSIGRLVMSLGIGLALIYGTLVLALARCVQRWRSARIVGFLALAVVPTVLFAIAWQGGDTERYIPLYPVLAFLLAGAVDRAGHPVARWVLGLAMLGALAVNAATLSVWRADKLLAGVEVRLGFLAAAGRESAVLIVATPQDPVRNVERDYERRAVRAGLRMPVAVLVDPSSPDAEHWTRQFASRVLVEWGSHRRVWVSRRVSAERPLRDWNWVEGDTHEIPWARIPALARSLEWGPAMGGDDGFMELIPSPANQSTLQRYIPPSP